MSHPIEFLLNNRTISLTEVGSNDTLLDFLRLDQRLTGTKEGCAEGDCGACTVLVGRLEGGLNGGRLRYEPVNACIRFLASCHGCHVVTVEHLGYPGDLHPVQAAMVRHHASQCGFCTPGFVMALYALWMENPDPSVADIETALQGNLCRCTGYEPIVRAAQAAAKAGGQDMDALARERDRVAATLARIPAGRREAARGDDRVILPADVADLAHILADHPKATIVAGATDVGLWVTKFLRPISPAVFIGHLSELKQIEEHPDEVVLGAGVTYSEALPVIETHYAGFAEIWRRIGGWQVRNAGTIGGNIANGSPIGETPPLLIALGAEVVLRSTQGLRRMAVEDFFIDYGKQDRRPGEFIETIHLPRCKGDLLTGYKVSKRRDADISAVSMGARIAVRDGIITSARLAFGGMAGIPKRAALAEAALTGAPFTSASFDDAARALAQDFTPMTDMRASARYRATVAANLIRRLWVEQTDPQPRLQRATA